ncbi:winged helix-turn-helix domain-containing protein [Micromonospora sediminicola]|uniref:winged helix-turn-helix domain-containing protein n=1 Tax=Micromonospora sediminicola TaxID=946078 RepID=UPI0037B5F2B5
MHPEHLYGHGDLADLLRERILTGQLAPGAVLPSDRYLQQQYGLGRETVRAALLALQAEGLVVRRQGKASRVRPIYDKQPIDLAGVVRMESRLPYPAEWDRLAGLGMATEPGVPVFVLVYADGREPVLRPADRWFVPLGGEV